MRRRVIIIGAGASGMMAAIQAARAGGDVTIMEHRERPGKKLLSTGNGRCNMTNLEQKKECYRCSNEGFPETVLRQFPVGDTLSFFEGLGILPKSRNGYIYPNSDQAVSVLEALTQELERLKVRIRCQCQVERITKEGREFAVISGQGVFRGEALILSAGSRAAPVTGSDGSGYDLAAAFGHRLIPPLPALVQLRCEEKHYRQLAGIRTEARVSLYVGEKLLAQDEGELQLTDYGISGIPTFQISRYAAVALHRRQKVTVRIGFLPRMKEEEIRALMERRRQSMEERTAIQWMNGLLNSKLSLVLLKLAGIQEKQKVKTLSRVQWDQLFRQITAYETRVCGVNSFEQAQVCCGGVDTRQVQATLESKLVKNLYFCGEILDVDGICGGYNLQWAWSSGAVAGREAAKGEGQEERDPTSGDGGRRKDKR